MCIVGDPHCFPESTAIDDGWQGGREGVYYRVYSNWLTKMQEMSKVCLANSVDDIFLLGDIITEGAFRCPTVLSDVWGAYKTYFIDEGIGVFMIIGNHEKAVIPIERFLATYKASCSADMPGTVTNAECWPDTWDSDNGLCVASEYGDFYVITLWGGAGLDEVSASYNGEMWDGDLGYEMIYREYGITDITATNPAVVTIGINQDRVIGGEIVVLEGCVGTDAFELAVNGIELVAGADADATKFTIPLDGTGWSSGGTMRMHEQRISGITAGDPTSINLAAHGYASTDSVFIGGITGDFSSLNDTQYTITKTNLANFTIPIDTTGKNYGAGGGLCQKLKTAANTQLDWLENTALVAAAGKPVIAAVHEFIGYTEGSGAGITTAHKLKIMKLLEEHDKNEGKVIVFEGHYHAGRFNPMMCLSFNSAGTHETVVGEIIKGGTSGATATVTFVLEGTGTWGGGDQTGFLGLENKVGDFEAENVFIVAADLTTVVAPNVATVFGDAVEYRNPHAQVLGNTPSDMRGNTFYIVDIDPTVGITRTQKHQYSTSSRDRYEPYDIDNGDNRGRERYA